MMSRTSGQRSVVTAKVLKGRELVWCMEIYVIIDHQGETYRREGVAIQLYRYLRSNYRTYAESVHRDIQEHLTSLYGIDVSHVTNKIGYTRSSSPSGETTGASLRPCLNILRRFKN